MLKEVKLVIISCELKLSLYPRLPDWKVYSAWIVVVAHTGQTSEIIKK